MSPGYRSRLPGHAPRPSRRLAARRAGPVEAARPAGGAPGDRRDLRPVLGSHRPPVAIARRALSLCLRGEPRRRPPAPRERPPWGSSQATKWWAIEQVGASTGAFYPGTLPPSWRRADYEGYLHSKATRTSATRANGGGPSSASGNPPFYYLLTRRRLPPGREQGALHTHGCTGSGWKAWCGCCSPALGAWLLAGETFGRRRLPQLLAAATVALLPMVCFISTSVNPDALTITRVDIRAVAVRADRESGEPMRRTRLRWARCLRRRS